MLLLAGGFAGAEDDVEAPPVSEVSVDRPPRFVVILPERIDHDWYWILFSDRSQHIVQSAVEKALVNAGLEVIDLSMVAIPSFGNDWQALISVNHGVQLGRQLNADYLITGQATAVQASDNVAYGVRVSRTQAEISARIVRVNDGRILHVEDASAQEGGQSAQAAGQNALKKAGAQLAGKVARLAKDLPVPEVSTP
jgi:curli biogenesis system outer membrane secretion channel CsgG